MAKQIKNFLIQTFLDGHNEDLIPNLIKHKVNQNSFYEPSQFLYNQIIDFKEDKFSDVFIELVYTTLISWNMNQRGAKLSTIENFKESILENRDCIKSMEKYRIENLSDSDLKILKIELEKLFKNLKLVKDTKPKLVTFSKALHFFLPNLLMPIDRSYTIQFFYGNTDIPNKDNDIGQFKMYWDILNEGSQFASVYNFESFIDNKWNRSIPKAIDNMIIAYLSTKKKNGP